MRYYFIAPVFYLDVPNVLKNGIEIKDKLKISNCELVKKFLENETSFLNYSGIESWNEILSCPCIYKVGNTEDWKDDSIFSHTFYLLRMSQGFLSSLWDIKDNSAYVRDGFTFSVNNTDNKEIFELQKGSVSTINSSASGERQSIRFSEDEIKEAVKKNKENELAEGSNFFNPPLNPINKKVDRISRAGMFISMARSSTILPIKIYNYCTALECIFNTSQSEIAHKVGQRAAIVLSSNYEERIDIFNQIKTAYNIRSKYTHGQSINVDEEKLKSISISLDETLRKLHNDNLLGFLQEIEEKNLDKYYDEISLKT